METLTGLDNLLTWQFWAASLFVVAVITTAKRAVSVASPALVQRGWFKAMLTAMNLVLGMVTAIPTGFLPGATLGQRLIVGCVAGAASHTVYHLVLKRFMGGGSSPVPVEEATIK